jgi:iron complex outermembrane recepter protein
LRYNHETRDFTVDYSNGPVRGNFVSGTVSDTALLPMVGITFEPDPDLLFYAKYSQGYQAPGFGFVPGPTAPANTFGPETLNAYEAGFKTQFLNRRITFNGAVFHYNYQDLQVRTQIREGQVGISNAASATIDGAEAELLIRATPHLTLRAHGTYLDATYGSFCETISVAAPLAGDPTCIPPGGTLPNGADRSGNRLNNAPRWSGGFGAEYSQPISDSATLSLNGNYTFESSAFFHAANQFGRNFGWHRLDARAAVRFSNGIEIFAYGRNLTNDRYCAFCLNQSNLVLSQSINDPRTYGAGFAYRF